MRIFISYRRADTQASAGRMAHFLDGIPAVEQVFLDVDDIGIGENFEQRIARTLAASSHALLLIGPHWSGSPGASGRPRIFDDEDMVRQEVRTVLRSKVKPVPVLVDGARMPHPDELPGDLKALSSINAFELRHAHFEEDMDDLLDALLGSRGGRDSRWRLPRLTPAGIALRALAGLAAGGALLVAIGIANRHLSDCYDLTCTLQAALNIPDESSARGLLSVLVLGVLALGALAPFLWRALPRRRP